MHLEISISESGKYVRVVAKGALTREVLQQIMKDAKRVFDEADPRPNGFLFDFREAPNVEPPSQSFAFVFEDTRRLKLDPTARAAVLVKIDDTSHNFPETAARNAGFIVRNFNDEGAAVGWLDSEAPLVHGTGPAGKSESDNGRP